MNDNPLFGAYECRLLVFMENDTYDGFRQVFLNQDQFKKISDAVVTEIVNENGQTGIQAVVLRKDADRVIPQEIFEGMNSINEP